MGLRNYPEELVKKHLIVPGDVKKATSLACQHNIGSSHFFGILLSESCRYDEDGNMDKSSSDFTS